MNPALKNFKDADLRKELEDRRIARITEAQEENRKWLDKAKYALTNEVIDFLAPTHTNDCSDANHWNGFPGSHELGALNCLRCGLLDIARGEASGSLGDHIAVLNVSLEVQDP